MPYVFIVLFLVGCNSLPAGDVSNLQQASPRPRRGQVILLRGWRGLYSAGVDQLATELQQQGVAASVYRETQWPAIADALIAHRPAEPLVLIGFSYGADNAIALSRKLGTAGVPVPLLITIDPLTPPDVPPNVAICRNFYRTNGGLDVFPFFRGVPLKADKTDATKLDNIRLQDHPDLDSPGLGHRTIAASPKVHRAIVDRVLQTCPPR